MFSLFQCCKDYVNSCIQEYLQLVLCWEVFPLSECPLSEVSLYKTVVVSLTCTSCVCCCLQTLSLLPPFVLDATRSSFPLSITPSLRESLFGHCQSPEREGGGEGGRD